MQETRCARGPKIASAPGKLPPKAPRRPGILRRGLMDMRDPGYSAPTRTQRVRTLSTARRALQFFRFGGASTGLGPADSARNALGEPSGGPNRSHTPLRSASSLVQHLFGLG